MVWSNVGDGTAKDIVEDAWSRWEVVELGKSSFISVEDNSVRLKRFMEIHITDSLLAYDEVICRFLH